MGQQIRKRSQAFVLCSKPSKTGLGLTQPMYNGHLELPPCSGVRRNFFRGGGGGSINSVEDRENGDLGAVTP
jgi:hypothetical protein